MSVRRFNPLSGSYVLVSKHRVNRPWLGATEAHNHTAMPSYDPTCYLCPGNKRAGGAKENPKYETTYVFDNDFPALTDTRGAEHGRPAIEQLYVEDVVSGTCRVICASPRHDLTLPRMSLEAIEALVHTYARETRELLSGPGIRHVQIFENKGDIMGCSAPHPHSQLWATSFVPEIPHAELDTQTKFHAKTGKCMLCEIVQQELTHSPSRIVTQNTHWLAIVPFWATWPFEILLLPKTHFSSLVGLPDDAAKQLAAILKAVTTKYDNLFSCSFPYSMGFHQLPKTDGELDAPIASFASPAWHLHAHFYPPLLRSASVKKFMVGFEMLAEAQRDILPEDAAARLRDLSETVHYTESNSV